MVTGIWSVVGFENSPDDILIQLQTECQVDLLCNAGTTVSWITAFHLNDGINDFFGWSLWTWFPPATWRVQ